jgi:hypothetical protein
MRTASCRALASTFHLRGCTFLLSLCLADMSMSKIRTSVIRPITRSPTSGLYLRRKWVTQVINSNFEIGVPRTQRSYRDELVDPFNGASNGCDNFIVIHISAMSPGNYHARERGREGGPHLMKARAEVMNSPGVVIVAFSASRSWSPSIKKSSPSLTSTRE